MKYRYLQGHLNGRMIAPFDVARSEPSDMADYAFVYEGEVVVPRSMYMGDATMAAAELVFTEHNRDDRPRGREIRSMSVGDVVVLYPEGRAAVALFCAGIGFCQPDGRAQNALTAVADSRAAGTIPLAWLKSEEEEAV
jgi:hypothetical protein